MDSYIILLYSYTEMLGGIKDGISRTSKWTFGARL